MEAMLLWIWERVVINGSHFLFMIVFPFVKFNIIENIKTNQTQQSQQNGAFEVWR